MKNSVLAVAIAIASFSIVSCSNNKTSEGSQTSESATAHDHGDSSAHEAEAGNPSVKAVVNDYMALKDALASDNGDKAAESGNKLVQSLGAFDKTSLTDEQKKTFEDIAEDATEHSEHIGKNASNIAHQREHFEMLSKDVYDLVKAVGAGEKLYQAHCPMYNNNKGANWLTTSKEINNPYMGSKMSTCGSIEEEL